MVPVSLSGSSDSSLTSACSLIGWIVLCSGEVVAKYLSFLADSVTSSAVNEQARSALVCFCLPDFLFTSSIVEPQGQQKQGTC